MEDFRLLCKLGAGTFSEVLKVKHRKTSKIYAMKRFRKHFNSFDEVEGLREIQALRRLNPHQNIVDLVDVVFDGKHGILSLNFELMECNLYELISRKGSVVQEGRAKGIIYQLLKALEYMHGKGIFHRDIKPENILVRDNLIKLADFGSCRGIHSKQPYTEYIATRWYRSPECLISEGMYSYKMDIWGVGCVLFETISKVPLFPGANQVDQLHRIHNTMGTPSPKLLKHMLGSKANHPKVQFPPKEGTGIRVLIPHASQECYDLIMQLLLYDPGDRLTAREALRHPFVSDVPADVGLIPSSALVQTISKHDVRGSVVGADNAVAATTDAVHHHNNSNKKQPAHQAQPVAVSDTSKVVPASHSVREDPISLPPHHTHTHLPHAQHKGQPEGANSRSHNLTHVGVQNGATAAIVVPSATTTTTGNAVNQELSNPRPPPAQIPPRKADKEHNISGSDEQLLAGGPRRKRSERKPNKSQRQLQQKGIPGELWNGIGVVGRNNPAPNEQKKLPYLSTQGQQQQIHLPHGNFDAHEYGRQQHVHQQQQHHQQNLPALNLPQQQTHHQTQQQQQQQAATAMMLMMQSNPVAFGKMPYNPTTGAKDQPQNITFPALHDRRHGHKPANPPGNTASKQHGAQR